MNAEHQRAAIPQELVDKIIDEVHDHRNSLKTCALVSWAWLPRSRVHLHRTITLYHQNCRIHPSQTASISTLLSLSAISEYTEELLLEAKTDYGLHQPNRQNDIDNGELFWRALARFAHVKTLGMTRLFWVSHSLENKNRLCAAFSSVTNLDVYMSDFADAREFLSLLTAFPLLTRLRVERVFWTKSAAEWYEASGSDPSSYRALPPDRVPGAALRHLQVQHCDVLMMADIAEWLVLLPNPRIETLHLSPPDGDDFEALPLYFSAIGTNLKHLTLALEFSINANRLRQAVAGLEANTRLQSLTLLANYGFGRKFVKAASVFWQCVLAILTGIATDHLHTIRFECQPEDLEDPAVLEADGLLARSTFRSLSSVVLVFTSVEGYTNEQLADMVNTALPKSAARGTLNVLYV